MKASKFTDAHKAFILKQSADGHAVAEIYRKTRISEMPTSIARRSMTDLSPTIYAG